MAAGQQFYFLRNAPQLIRLDRRQNVHPLSPTGSFCCTVPTTGRDMTLCANLVLCPSLSLDNGMVTYNDNTLGLNAVATHTCNTGYTLNSGTSTRTCGTRNRFFVVEGVWSESALICEVLKAVITSSGSPMASQSLALTCSVTGEVPLLSTAFYQWRRGESLLTNSPTLQFDSLYLSDIGPYRCVVTLFYIELGQKHNLSETYTIEFTSLHIQLRLKQLSNCRVYIESDITTKVSDIADRLSQGVEELCGCGFSPFFLSEEFIDCFDESPNHVTYRAVVTGTENAFVVEIAHFIEEWVSKGGSIIVQSTRLGLTSSCPVVIAHRDSPECPQDITNRTLTTVPPTPALNVGTVAGGVVTGVFAVVLILVAMLLVVWARRRPKSTKTSNDRESSQPPEVDPPPVTSSEEYDQVGRLQQDTHIEDYQHLQPFPTSEYKVTTHSLLLNEHCLRQYKELNQLQEADEYVLIDQYCHPHSMKDRASSIHSLSLEMVNEYHPRECKEVNTLEEDDYVLVDQRYQPYFMNADCHFIARRSESTYSLPLKVLNEHCPHQYEEVNSLVEEDGYMLMDQHS